MATVEDKIDFIMLVISSFAKRFGISNSEAYRYLAQYKGLELCEAHYGIMHTLSDEDNVDSLANFCRRQGGTL
jgi:transposase